MPRTKAGLWKHARSPYWQVKVKGPDGRWQTRSSRTKVYREAREILDRLKAGHAVPLFSANRVPGFGTFATFYLRVLADNDRRPRTIESATTAIRHLARHFRGRRLDRIATGDVDAYKRARRARGIAAPTVNRELQTLQALLRLAVARGVIERMPCEVRKLPIERRIERPTLGPDARRRLLEACRDDRELMMVGLALETGLRRAELCWLRWDDLDPLRGELLIRGKTDGDVKWAPKNRQERRMPLSAGAVGALLAYRARQKGSPAWIFPGRNTGRFKSPAKSLRQLFRRAGIYQRGVTLHALRHTFATEALAAGNDVETVRSLLGHADIGTTQRYLHASEARQRTAVEGLGLGSMGLGFGRLLGRLPRGSGVSGKGTPKKGAE